MADPRDNDAQQSEAVLCSLMMAFADDRQFVETLKEKLVLDAMVAAVPVYQPNQSVPAEVLALFEVAVEHADYTNRQIRKKIRQRQRERA
jgi:hypothetical protein